MIEYRLWNATTEPSLHHDMGRIYPVGNALAKIVDILGVTHLEYGSWIEDMQPESCIIKIGSNDMAGERWIHVFKGPSHEIYQLMQVCWWFYQVTGEASDAVKAATPRVVCKVPDQALAPNQIPVPPLHGGYPGTPVLTSA